MCITGLIKEVERIVFCSISNIDILSKFYFYFNDFGDVIIHTRF